MHESVVEVSTGDSIMATRIFHPAAASPLPLVVIFMDAFGVRDALAAIARRIASDGYVVALPNLFHRAGTFAPFDPRTAFTDPAERGRIMALIRSLVPAQVIDDVRALIAHCAGERSADTSRVCVVGYCMGGGHALRMAGAFPDRVVAAASYHGGHLATESTDSPHLSAAKATGRLYIGYAENDGSFPEAERERLVAALTDAGVAFTVEGYTAAHGFAVPDQPVYDERAAARHYETLFALLRESTASG
jgi:carboxymethylenebutenolidase